MKKINYIDLTFILLMICMIPVYMLTILVLSGVFQPATWILLVICGSPFYIPYILVNYVQDYLKKYFP